MYPGPHMCAMFSYTGDSTVSTPQRDKIYLRVISIPVIVAGNPGVFQAYPYPYPAKPVELLETINSVFARAKY